MEFRIPPVRRHLAPAGSGIVLRADALQQHLVRRLADHEGQRAVAIIGEEPVVPGFQHQARGHQDGFMPCPADLKEDLVLALELDFAVVNLAGEKHRAVNADQGVARSSRDTWTRREAICLEFHMRGQESCLRSDCRRRAGGFPFASLYPNARRANTRRRRRALHHAMGKSRDQSSESKSSAAAAKAASPWRTVSPWAADLKGSSAGMRSSQRCSVSFSWSEKSRRIRMRTFEAA